MNRILGILVMLFLAPPAQAGLTRTELNSVAVDAPVGARLPTGLTFRNLQNQPETLDAALHGRPAIVVFTDYTCKTLCGPILRMASMALADSGLAPGRDFRLLVIGLDPRDSPATAQRFAQPQIASAIWPATDILLSSPDSVAAAAQALGYRYIYDAEHDQFAHPTVLFAVDRTGRLTAALSAAGIDGASLRLALVDAGRGVVGGLVDRIRLLCYCYDPATGIYSRTIQPLIDGAAIATALLLAAGIGWQWRRERRGISR